MDKNDKFHQTSLGDGYYLEYRFTDNGLGGNHPVNMMLYKDDGIFVKEITDKFGNFIDFPGVEEGAWMESEHMEFYSCMRFLFRSSQFNEDGICDFFWMFQPDGRYFSDEAGFGWEPYQELWFRSEMNKNGDFICPFREYDIHIQAVDE